MIKQEVFIITVIFLVSNKLFNQFYSFYTGNFSQLFFLKMTAKVINGKIQYGFPSFSAQIHVSVADVKIPRLKWVLGISQSLKSYPN